MGNCIVAAVNFFCCGNSGHVVKYFPLATIIEKRVTKHKQVLLIPMILRRTTSILSNDGVIKRIHPMLLLVCYKYIELMFMHC